MRQRHTLSLLTPALLVLLSGLAAPLGTAPDGMRAGSSSPDLHDAPLVAEITPREMVMLGEVEKAAVRAARLDPDRLTPLPPEQIDAETLWLARCIFSETKLPEEQELVAWVVRNRVETQYRGNRTYQEAVLDAYQFSAFNPEEPDRAFYVSLSPRSRWPGWQQALAIAEEVRRAEALHRPFPVETRHFYSERSMRGRRHPVWAKGQVPIEPNRRTQIDERRFRFFAYVS